MRKIFSLGMFMTLAFALAVSGPVFRPIFRVDAQKGATDIDVQHYKIDAELVPASQLLKARAEVRFVPQSETRSVVFEMNGSLTISRITRVDPSAATTPGAGAPGGRGQSPKPAPPKANLSPQPATDGLQFIQDNRENMNVRID